MERGEYFTNPHEHVANLNEYVANQSERVANMLRAPTIMSGLRLKRYNGRDHRVATNKLNIKTCDNRDFGASHGYHDSLRGGLPDHRARLNQRLVPGALRPRR